MRHATGWSTARSLSYRQVNTDRDGRYRITKTYTTDPSRSALLVDVRFESRTGRPLQLYALYDPALSNAGDDDTGATAGRRADRERREGGERARRRARRSRATSSGYLGASDGWTDLASDFRMDWRYASAPAGQRRPDGADGARPAGAAPGR